MKAVPQVVPTARQLTDDMGLEIQISYLITIVENLVSFGTSPANVKRFGINTREWRILFTVGNLGPSTARQIIAAIVQDKATVSRAISSLETKRLISKLPNKHHRRSPYIGLTKKGEQLFAQIMPVFVEQTNRFTAVLTHKEKNQLSKLLYKLKEHSIEVRQLEGLDL